MRLLIWHVDAFGAEPTERGRSKIAMDAADRAGRGGAGGLRRDREGRRAGAGRGGGARRAAAIDVARRLGARTVVLHSFAHLFVELSTPATAKAILDKMQSELEAQGYSVQQSAFGWLSLHFRVLVLRLPAPVERHLPHTASAHSHAA